MASHDRGQEKWPGHIDKTIELERGRGNVTVISRVIDWCARNRFLVFTGTLLLVLAGIWSLRNIPLDALPDISDVQVIVHVPWEGEPPNIIKIKSPIQL